MKKFNTTLVLLAALTALVSFPTQAQTYSTGAIANFGIDGDVKSGEHLEGSFTAANTDDWFTKNSGRGVIDTTGASIIKAALIANGNSTYSKGMAYPQYSVQGGKLLMDGIYVRDNMGLSGSIKDSTSFANGAKNGQSPDTWGTSPNGAQVIDKTDIIDGFAHMRRNGTITTGSNPDHLMLFMGASTAASSGNRFVDLELYKTRLAYNKATGIFTNQGPASTGGHTTWEFNANGTIRAIGDVDITFDFSSSNITDIGVYLWVSKTNVQTVTPAGFDFMGTTEFYGDGQNATYGYAKIKAKNGGALPVWGSVNTSNTDAPVWGTTSKDWGTSNTNYYSTQYAAGQFAEVGTDLTALGIDMALSTSNDPCTAPFTRMLIKSRSSSAFTSALSDFTGPYAFLDVPQISPTILAPGNLACNAASINLNPQVITSGALYTWTTTDGSILGAANTPVITVNKVGKYFLYTSAAAGCSQLVDSVTVKGDYYKPVALAYRLGTISAITTAALVGGDLNASNYATPFGGSSGLTWNWTGPVSFASGLQNPVVATEGSYKLVVTEIRNGCTDTSITYVPSSLILPVTLIEFTGSNNNGIANLKWNTATEINMNRFEIERSSDAVSFKNIGLQKATGNSSANVDYSFTDNQMLNGANYYRLKMINNDGTFSYSKVVMINSNEKGMSFYIVYPNPFGATLQAKIESLKAEKGIVRIMNSNGTTVKVQTVLLLAGTTNITMNDMTALAPGSYYFEIITSTQTSKTKIIKQ